MPTLPQPDAAEFSAMLESTVEGVFSLDREWRFTYLNHQAEILSRRGRESLLGRHIWDEYPEMADTRFCAEYERAVREQVIVHFEEFYEPFMLWLDVRAHPGAGGLTVFLLDITARKLAAQALLRSEERFRSVFNQQFQFMALLSPEGRVQEINDVLALGVPRGRNDSEPKENVLGKPIWETIWWSDLEPEQSAWPQRLQQAAATRGPVVSEDRFRAPDGKLRIAQAAITAVKDVHGEVDFFIVQGTDITDRKQAEETLRRSEAALANAQRIGHIGSWVWDMDTDQLHWSDEVFRLFRIEPEDFSGTVDAFYSAVHPDDRDVLAAAVQDALAGLAPYDIEHRITGGDGIERMVHERGEIIYDENGEPIRMVGTAQDITERKKAQENIQRLAYFDSLTGLPNRRLLLDRMATLLARAQRNPLVGAVLYIDLDNFKNVNDARGHAVGDELLQKVGQRLSTLLREEDTVARLGGDEFVVLISSVADNLEVGARAAMEVAEKLRQALELPFNIDGEPYNSGGSIGVTLFPNAGERAEDLLREADTAMYRAKHAGRNRIAFFEAAMQAEVEERLSLEHDLAGALAANELAMVVQPQVDAHGVTVGAELLMRWQHRRRGSVSPARFIPLAEKNGLIVRLGTWALRQCCQLQMRLLESGHAPLPLSINVSPRQFRQPDFIDSVRQVLADTGADGHHLIFEVTEGLLIENLEDTVERMHELATLGIRFSIDDFGTGYSSLGYLRQLPLYELKIDRSFVQDTPHDASDTAIVQAIMSMARHLGLRVVAEGVETREQADFLVAGGCDCLQGFLFAAPMPMQEWLADVTQARLAAR